MLTTHDLFSFTTAINDIRFWQNNVLELWSLFDFLMPGLLGTERQFTARYSRPILAARDAKATPHQLQAGALACEALHRQVTYYYAPYPLPNPKFRLVFNAEVRITGGTVARVIRFTYSRVP